jgi:hypothetical protein
MLRKLCIIPTFAAMLMVMFVTFVPHHHHQAMICLVHETCEADGCVNDEHTGHSDANHEEDESHCISHEKYFPSDDLRVDFNVLLAVTAPLPSPSSTTVPTVRHHYRDNLSLSSPPVLTWRMRC